MSYCLLFADVPRGSGWWTSYDSEMNLKQGMNNVREIRVAAVTTKAHNDAYFCRHNTLQLQFVSVYSIRNLFFLFRF